MSVRSGQQRRRVLLATTVAAVALAGAAALWTAEASGAGVSTASAATFSHLGAQHARTPCLLCHTRTAGATQMGFPGHTPCAGCHAQEFADGTSPMCTICHTDPASGAVRRFPGLHAFGAAFDHATHDRGAARPRDACGACHTPGRTGKALTVPQGAGAHATCFRCHTPSAQSGGRDLSSCGVCHRLGGARIQLTLTSGTKVGFDHGEHAGARLSCSACHDVRRGVRSKQVSAPVASQHHAPAGARSCATCHDGRRAFGGDDFSSCKRCHTGDTWQFR